jgi:hypothetical protein
VAAARAAALIALWIVAAILVDTLVYSGVARVLAAPAGSPVPFVVAKLTAAVAVLAGAVALLRARRSAMGLFVFPNWRRWPLWLGLLAPIWAGAVANVAVGQGPPLARTTLLWLAGTIGVGVY